VKGKKKLTVRRSIGKCQRGGLKRGGIKLSSLSDSFQGLAGDFLKEKGRNGLQTVTREGRNKGANSGNGMEVTTQ